MTEYRGFKVKLNQGYYKGFRRVGKRVLRVYIGSNIEDSQQKIDAYISKNKDLFNKNVEHNSEVIQQYVEQISQMRKIIDDQEEIIEDLLLMRN